MEYEDALEMLQMAAAKLGEHFEAVQITASWTEAGVTQCVKDGCGNWYARLGMTKEFIAEQESGEEWDDSFFAIPPVEDDEEEDDF